jgi:twitching motility protein PilT
MTIKKLLQYAVAQRASDLHLAAGNIPVVRIDGCLHKIGDTQCLDDEAIRSMLLSIIPEEQKTLLTTLQEIDFAFSISGLARFRVNIFKQQRGISAVFRIISTKIPTFAQLGLPAIFAELCDLSHGLILVTGPTGSGKTTTLAAMIDYINHEKAVHVLTIEDPIEYVYTSEQALIQQREVGVHTESFAEALRAALREDPNYILLGEMRDLETIRLALTAAETGHLVFATLHTNSAAESINRIIDVFPAQEKDLVRATLANTLQAVVAQILVKKIGGGRVAAQEIMVCTAAVRNMIRENKVPQIYSAMQTGQNKGMRTLGQQLRKLVDDKVIAEDELNC